MNVSIKTVLVVSLIALLCQPVDLFARPGGGGGYFQFAISLHVGGC